MKRFRVIALLMALMLVLAACSSDDGGEGEGGGEGGETTTTESVDLGQGSDLTFHMVTHADDGVFWSVVKKGAEAAAAAVGLGERLFSLVVRPGYDGVCLWVLSYFLAGLFGDRC